MTARTRSAGLFLLVLSLALFAVSLIMVTYSVPWCAPAPSGGCQESGATWPLVSQAEWPTVLSIGLFLVGLGVLVAGRDPKPVVQHD